MPASQNIAHFFRILYMTLFVFSSLLVLTSMDPSMFDFAEVLKIVNYMMLFVQEIIRALGGIAFYVVQAILSIKASIPFIGDPNFPPNYSVVSSSLSNILDPQNSFFPHSTLTIEDPQVLIDDFSHFFGATAIMILLPIALLSGIGFLREGDTKLAIYSFLGFQLIIIIAIFTQKILISTAIDSANLFSMLFSPLFALGFLLYLLLEIAFQTSYILNIVEPMTEREKRIQEHLKRVRTFVPKSEEEEKGREHSVQSVQSKKFDLLAASYLREMVERRVFKKGETVRDTKSMMRLQSYLAGLNQNDPQTEMKLAAKTAQPNISALLKHFIPAMILRIIAVVLISYFIMAPEGILNLFIAASFPALLDSLELSQPEFRTIAILNVALLVVLISAILHYLTSGRTGKVLVRVVQQIDTLVEFQRGSRSTSASGEVEEEVEDLEEPQRDSEEEIS